MPVFDQLERASFDGIAFPVERVQVTSSLRHHIHLYPHSPGGALEKLGRELYRITMLANFQVTFPKWGDTLWPGDMADLRDRFENELTSDLVIPTIGKIKACIVNWDQEMVAKIRSGEKVTIQFIEDQSSAFLVNGLINVKVDLAESIERMTELAEDLEAPLGNIGDTLTEIANAVTAIGDQIELAGDLVSAKIEGVMSACAAIDDALSVLDDPEHWELLYAVHDVWDNAVRLRDDVLSRSTPIVTFTTPTVMTVGDIANRLYGSTERASQILQLNAFEDPFAIPANKNVRAYAA